MTHDPVLAMKKWTEQTEYPRVRNDYCKLVVNGGLHYLRGNSAPYFTITATLYINNSDRAGGCMHDEIERRFPGRFSDLIALHLSNIYGVPMHFEVNGWYDLAGALGGAGQRYHVGNSERHFTITPPADKPWQTTEYRQPTQAECLQIFADHCRIPLAEAAKIAAEVKAEFGPEGETYYEAAPWSASDYARGKAKWVKIAATMTERFQAEAKACIAKHKLVVFGDPWQAAA